MARIIEAKAKPKYRLWMRFDDGSQGEVDLSSLVGKGVFSTWEDPKAFAKVAINREAGTVAWPGGIDLCPEMLYHDITGVPLPGFSPTGAR